MKLKYLLKKTINIKNGYLLAILITLTLVIGGCFSYAVFTARSEAKGALNIVTGNLYSIIDSTDLDANKSITISPGSTKQIYLNLINANGIDTKVNLYYSSTSANIDIGYLLNGDEAPTNTGIVLGKNGSETDSKTINIQIRNNDTIDTTITFGTTAGLSTANLAFPTNQSSLNKINNMYISNVYTYDDTNVATKCITGEEETCQESDCYENKTSGICTQGTIVKYAVNDSEEKYFYVLHDDGATLTLQQRENTINNVVWYASNDNSQGPLTILPQLESTTESWTNVNNQTYTMGTTNFNGTSAFTGCDSYNSCTTNTYTLAEKISKSRMITMQEAASIGCTGESKTCPKWMYNYLYQSTSYGGTIDDNGQVNNSYNWGYSTMSANSSISSNAWYVSRNGRVYSNYTATYTNYGARAVIVISK